MITNKNLSFQGDDCPYRHEPAALRNETMCVYWLRGHCTKEHCIFRHMEITVSKLIPLIVA